MRRLAEGYGRTVRFGIRLHVIARETDAEAFAAADELIKHVSDSTIAAAQQAYQRTESEGQKRMASLHNGRRDQLEIYPNLWAGVGLVRGGAGTALVGSGESIARLMQEYVDLGIDTFVLSGYPSLEESYACAEYVFPHINLGRPDSSPFNPHVIPHGRSGYLNSSSHSFSAAPTPKDEPIVREK